MNPARTTHRVVVAATAIGAVAAGLLSGVPAQAATALPVIRLGSLPTLALPAAPATVQPDFHFTTTATSFDLEDVRITVDARGLAKVAKVAFSDNCTVKNLVATCTEDFYKDPSEQYPDVFAQTQMTLTALKGAKLGSTGSYKVTGHSAGATIVGGTGSIVLGGPALALKQLANHTKLKIGSTVSEPIQFTNVGNRPATGAKILLMASTGLTLSTHYANCTYGRIGNVASGTQVAICSPKGAIRIGEVAALTAPVKLHVDKTALYTYLDAQTLAAGDSTFLTGVKWTKGKGQTLGLKIVKPGKASSVPAGKISTPFSGKASGYQIASLQATNTADFGVTGASRTAAAGTTTTFAFTSYANGPATLYDRSGGEAVPGIVVTPPPGTTIVSSSANCLPYQEDNPEATDHGPYNCSWGSIDIAKGTKIHFTLTVRVDTVTAGAKGSVKLTYGPLETSPYNPPYDKVHTNDSAVLSLN